MATNTAQLLIGSAQQNDSGITGIHHTMYLSENSRPAWILTNHDRTETITWIPTIENMLEDGLLMIGLYVLKDEELITNWNKFFIGNKPHFVELYDDLNQEQRSKLYERCRNIVSYEKVVFTILSSSSISNQLEVLRNYEWNIEVCMSVYKKEYSAWSEKREERGSLKV